jgi:hypothetical protein
MMKAALLVGLFYSGVALAGQFPVSSGVVNCRDGNVARTVSAQEIVYDMVVCVRDRLDAERGG